MPAGIIPKGANFIPAIGGTSSASDTGASARPFQYNPTTRGMTVHIVGNDILTSDQEVDLIKVGGTVFSLGQQLAASSLPVVLTAAQISTLTPLATVAVTNAGLTSLNGAIAGTEVQVDVVAAIPAGTNAIGKFGHDITGIAHGVKTITAAGTDEALAGSTTAKEVTIQSQTDNTGLIAVGGSGVDATEATGNGIILYAGDSVTIQCDNLADIFIDASVSGEGVRYFYLT